MDLSAGSILINLAIRIKNILVAAKMLDFRKNA